MHNESQIISLLILLHTRGLGRIGIWKLLKEFGSSEKIVEVGWDPQRRVLLGRWEVANWEEDLEEVAKKGIRLLTYRDPAYPKNLLNIPDFPLLLYVKGELLAGDNASVAIIGTRNATLYGKQSAEKIAQELAASGVCVVSGLARGIDTAAHEGALKGRGRTIAIIGSGLSQIYPPENLPLCDQIASAGAVISEFPMQMPPARGLFPKRNRVISGMSQGVCLIESPQKGGGMITMQIAEQQKKPLFALPGRVDWPTFEGNHALLKQQKVRLVENGNDLLKSLNLSQNQEVKRTTSSALTPEERAFLEKLPAEEKSIEELVLLTQLPIIQLNVLVTRLVLKKVMKEFPGKIYKRVFTK
jgi:DNA processing protein